MSDALDINRKQTDLTSLCAVRAEAEFGKLGTRKRSVYMRPATVPRPFHLATPQRSRRPQSIEGIYPPAKAPGVPLNVRLQLRDIYLHPPRCATMRTP